jgi:hypothetical protein
MHHARPEPVQYEVWRVLVERAATYRTSSWADFKERFDDMPEHVVANRWWDCGRAYHLLQEAGWDDARIVEEARS